MATWKHPLSPSEYAAWGNMKARCSNPRHPSFQDYGARGITVCSRWSSFSQFLEDMGPKPSPLHWLERANNEEGYSPGNCLWATRRAQLNNTRRNHRVTHAGETLTIAQWGRKVGLHPETIRNRLAQGYPVEKALSAQSFARGNFPA